MLVYVTISISDSVTVTIFFRNAKYSAWCESIGASRGSDVHLMIGGKREDVILILKVSLFMNVESSVVV